MKKKKKNRKKKKVGEKSINENNGDITSNLSTVWRGVELNSHKLRDEIERSGYQLS